MNVYKPVRSRGMLEMINRHRASTAFTILYLNSALCPRTNSRLLDKQHSGQGQL